METNELIKKFVVPGTADDLFGRVLNTVDVPMSLDPRWIQGKIKQIDREIKAVQSFMNSKSVFRVEKVHETGYVALEELLQLKMQFLMAKYGYSKRLYPQFLSWVDSENLPKFIVLNWDSVEDFELTVKVGDGIRPDSYSTNPYLHPQIAMQYFGVADHLLSMSRTSGWESVSISAHFAGTIPNSTRKLMLDAQASGLFDQFYISAPAEDWSINRTIRVVNPDPIVFASVSVDGGMKDQFYVIDVFDLTEIERAAMDQYVLGPH